MSTAGCCLHLKSGRSCVCVCVCVRARARVYVGDSIANMARGPGRTFCPTTRGCTGKSLPTTGSIIRLDDGQKDNLSLEDARFRRQEKK